MHVLRGFPFRPPAQPLDDFRVGERPRQFTLADTNRGLCNGFLQLLLGLFTIPGRVIGDHQLLMAPENGRSRQWFLLKHIETRTRKRTPFERRQSRGPIHQRASRGVD